MRGQWTSQTRRLNRHYQSAGSKYIEVPSAVLWDTDKCPLLPFRSWNHQYYYGGQWYYSICPKTQAICDDLTVVPNDVLYTYTPQIYQPPFNMQVATVDGSVAQTTMRVCTTDNVLNSSSPKNIEIIGVNYPMISKNFNAQNFPNKPKPYLFKLENLKFKFRLECENISYSYMDGSYNGNEVAGNSKTLYLNPRTIVIGETVIQQVTQAGLYITLPSRTVTLGDYAELSINCATILATTPTHYAQGLDYEGYRYTDPNNQGVYIDVLQSYIDEHPNWKSEVTGVERYESASTSIQAGYIQLNPNTNYLHTVNGKVRFIFSAENLYQRI